ncbi:MAG: sugar phosphate nucleotidyltransferase [Halobacteriales archaeon]
MKAIVPAAGRGTRLRPRTDDRPKALVEVAGKPLLTRVFETLDGLETEFEAFVVVVGYRGDAIIEQYGEQFRDTPLQYVEQANPLGLAHAVRQADHLIDEPFFVMNGDNLFDNANLDAVWKAAREEHADGALLVTEASYSTAKTTGVCEISADGTLQSIVEKPADPPTTLINTGVAVLPSETMHACHLVQPSDRGEYELPAAIELLLSAGFRITTVRLDGWRCNVNTPDDLESATARFE